MGKFCLKETKKDLGISSYNAICPIGSRVSQNYRSGNITIMFNEIISARAYINRDVLRKALLDDPIKTEKLLGIKVMDTVPKVIYKPKPTPTIIKDEDDTFVETEAVEPPEIEVPEYKPEAMVIPVEVDLEFDKRAASEDNTASLGVKLNKYTKAELLEFAAKKQIPLEYNMTKVGIIEAILATEMEE